MVVRSKPLGVVNKRKRTSVGFRSPPRSLSRSILRAVGKGKKVKEVDKTETSETLVHEPSTISKVIVRHKKPLNMKLANGENMFYSSNIFSDKSTENRRFIQPIAYINTVSQWNVSSGGTYNQEQACVNWFDLNPSRVTTGSGYYGAITPSADLFLHTKTTFDIQLSNASNSCSHIELFVCEYKVDTAKTVVDLWNDGFGRDGLGGGFWDLGTGAAGYVSLDTALFTSPMESSSFKDSLKVLYCKKFSMAGGSLEHVHLDVADNFLGRLDKIQNITSGTKFMKGTTVIFYTHFGQLGWFDNLIATDVPGNTTSEILVKVDKRDHFRSVAASVNRLRATTGAQIAQTSAPANAETLMNVVDGAVQVLSLF